jgi:hypothetical protein
LNFTSIIGILITALTCIQSIHYSSYCRTLEYKYKPEQSCDSYVMWRNLCIDGKIVFYTGAQIAGNLIIMLRFC